LPQDGLAQVLRQLEPWQHPDLLVGTNTCDDAGVFRLSDELALVQTTDFFPPLVDDPYDFGRIAAANALSDVYAMGGEPLTALNIVGFPDKVLPIEILADILRGGADVCRAAGAVVVGGHSVRDSEVKFGLAVTGRVHPQRILTNAAARPGDRLVLTKPLGTGVLVSARKAGKIEDEALAEAVHSMTSLNRAGRDAALRAGVRACTDITGFGLIGHAYEMAAGSDVTIVLESGNVPLFARVLELARAGVTTRASKTARAYLAERLAVATGVEEALADILANAETSGGLLLSVADDRCAMLLEELRREGAVCATVVGRVDAAETARVRVTAGGM
jgi:selenide,water dikinase